MGCVVGLAVVPVRFKSVMVNLLYFWFHNQFFDFTLIEATGVPMINPT
jgi:hypothetical protein